jgi:hypothetical protein
LKKIPVLIVQPWVLGGFKAQAILAPWFKYRDFISFLKYNPVSLQSQKSHFSLLNSDVFSTII